MIAVARSGGAYFAIEDICTHDGAELTGGAIEGTEIICPRHGARFCLRTGEALSPPATNRCAFLRRKLKAAICGYAQTDPAAARQGAAHRCLCGGF